MELIWRLPSSRTSPLCWWDGRKNSRPGEPRRDRKKGDRAKQREDGEQGNTTQLMKMRDPFGLLLPRLYESVMGYRIVHVA